MPEEMPKLDEVKKIAEKFVREHRKIDLNKQGIDIDRIELTSSAELGQHYVAEGKVKNLYENSRGFDGFGDVFESFFGDPSQPKKAVATKECEFKLSISVKSLEVMTLYFKDTELSTQIIGPPPFVPGVSILGESPTESTMDFLDSISKIDKRDAKTELDRELTKDIKDRRKRRKDII